MEQIHITINGENYKIGANITILDAVEQTKSAKIPTLCYEKKLGHTNSCYLCVVEVKGARTLMPACSTKVTDGMIIETDTPAVVSARQECLSLLLSDHYADCYSPCRKECPAEVDIQGYLKLANQGYYKEAVELIKKVNPLPIVCGRVCVRPCELKCRRELIDSSIAIDAVKRAISESGDGLNETTNLKNKKQIKIAVIGSGPAGLSFAYYALKEGISVTLFEAMPKAGGMLRYGIPSYRLPKELLDIEIDKIANMGAEFKYNTKIGNDIKLEELKNGFDYVFVANGAWLATNAGIENEDSSNVISGLKFLRQAYKGEFNNVKGLNVSVIGGGNTAVDAARTAIRLGAQVTIIYRRSEAEMPAHHEEIDAAKKEGVKMLLLTAPKKNSEDGLECIRMELGEPDSSGRRRPKEINGSEFTHKTDLVITAVGQGVELDFLPKAMITERGRVSADKLSFETDDPKIYAGGDCLTGPATVIEAIAAGRKALESICKKQNKEFFTAKEIFSKKIEAFSIVNMPISDKMYMAEISPEKRITNFNETETNFTDGQVISESSRCLACGCNATDYCLLKRYAHDYNVTDFTKGSREIKKPDISHPNIILDGAKCIKCQRCIKTCENINGYSILGLKNRGFATSVVPSGDVPLAETKCISCGNCIDSCPTGAISDKDGYFAFADELKITNCILCGSLCKIGIKKFGKYIKTTSARRKTDGEGDYVCKRGRFEISDLFKKDRLNNSYINKNVSSFESACGEIANRFKEVAEQYSSDNIGIFLSPLLSSENIYAGVKLGKGIIGTESVFSQEQYSGSSLNTAFSTADLNELDKTDIILLIGKNPEEFMPALNWKVREAVKKGAKLIVNSAKTALSNIASKTIEAIELEDIIEVSEVSNPKIIAVCTKDISKNQFISILNLLEKTGNSHGLGRGLLIPQNGANAEGLKKWGAIPGHLPGFMSYDNEKDMSFFQKLWGVSNLKQRQELKQEEIRAALFIGEVPSKDYLKSNFKNLNFIATCTFYGSNIDADVTIPLVSILETGGNMTYLKGEEKRVPPAVPSYFEYTPSDIFNKIAECYDGRQLNISEDIDAINTKKEN